MSLKCVGLVVYVLVSGAMLVAVAVSSGARARSAAMPPPPLPGARAWTAPFSWCWTRASPPAVTRARPDRNRIWASRKVSLVATNSELRMSKNETNLLCSLLRDLVLHGKGTDTHGAFNSVCTRQTSQHKFWCPCSPLPHSLLLLPFFSSFQALLVSLLLLVDNSFLLKIIN